MRSNRSNASAGAGDGGCVSTSISAPRACTNHCDIRSQRRERLSQPGIVNRHDRPIGETNCSHCRQKTGDVFESDAVTALCGGKRFTQPGLVHRYMGGIGLNRSENRGNA